MKNKYSKGDKTVLTVIGIILLATAALAILYLVAALTHWEWGEHFFGGLFMIEGICICVGTVGTVIAGVIISNHKEDDDE